MFENRRIEIHESVGYMPSWHCDVFWRLFRVAHGWPWINHINGVRRGLNALSRLLVFCFLSFSIPPTPQTECANSRAFHSGYHFRMLPQLSPIYIKVTNPCPTSCFLKCTHRTCSALTLWSSIVKLLCWYIKAIFHFTCSRNSPW